MGWLVGRLAVWLVCRLRLRLIGWFVGCGCGWLVGLSVAFDWWVVLVGWLVGRLVGWLMVLSPCLFVSHCFTGIRRRWCREAFAHACVRLRANSYARARSHLTPWVLPRHAQIGYIYNTCPRLVCCFFYCIFCNARGDRACVSRYSIRRVALRSPPRDWAFPEAFMYVVAVLSPPPHLLASPFYLCVFLLVCCFVFVFFGSAVLFFCIRCLCFCCFVSFPFFYFIRHVRVQQYGVVKTAVR